MKSIHSLVPGCLVAVLVLCFPYPAQAYVEAPLSFGSIVAQSSNIMLLRVEKVDREKNLIIYSKVRDLKGKHPTDTIKHNVGRGGFHPREWQVPMQWAEPGKLAVFFHNGGASETCLGKNWYQAYAGGEWWNMSHGEPFLLRSFAGSPEKLAVAVTAIVAGQEVVIPCMVDGNKDDLHHARAKIQRLRASLKLADYNPKRDFVGWGGDDFRRLAGMPGFTHLSALSRVDPEALAISSVDMDGDGKLDLCLVGASRVVLLQNGGESLNELSLPGVRGARVATWADYNGDDKPDLLLATPGGPRLFTNIGGGNFRDDTALLPREPGYNLTAGAWLDYDGDGKPDILLGNGFHGLRLYRNTFPLTRLSEMIKDLDSDQFALREKASRELELMGTIAEEPLRKVLENPPSLETKKRIDLIFENWKNKAKVPPAPAEPSLTSPWFEDVSEKMGLGLNGVGGATKGDTLTVADVNGDGRPDFLYGTGTGLLALNTPKGFVEAKNSGIAYQPGKVQPVFGDFDGDKHLDLFVPQANGGKLFKNDGKGRFTDVTATSGLAKFTGQATSAAWGDVNKDGKLDLVIGCLRGPNRFFRNQGDGTFVDATETLGLEQRIFNTQAVCLVDLNKDGVLDFVFNNEGQDSVVLLGKKD